MKRVSDFLENLDKRRDKAFQLGKEIIKLSTTSIVNTFSENFEESEKILMKIEEKMKEFDELFDKELLKIVGDFYTTVKQEYVEAKQFYSIVKEKKILEFEEFEGVGEVEWLLGTFDAIGELSRKMYDVLLKNDKETFLKYLELMEEFYNKTFPLSVYKFISGLRYRIDLTRKKIEEFKKIALEIYLK